MLLDQTIFVCKMILDSRCSDSPSWIRQSRHVIPFFPVTQRLSFGYESCIAEVINHAYSLDSFVAFISLICDIETEVRKYTGKSGTLFSSYS